MKKFLSIIFVIAIVLNGAYSFAVDVNFQTGFNYDWWESNKDDRGRQFYIPVQIGSEYENFSFLLQTAYIYAKLNPSNRQGNLQPEDVSLKDVIDTKINFSYELLDKFPIDILFGLDFNLPTGRTQLRTKELALILDPDLVSIHRFGEGFNINPTATFVKEWENWAAGMGVGYVWRGEYDYSSEINDYDPGDIFSLTGEIDYRFSPAWETRFFAEYAHYSKDQVDDVDFYHEGELLLIGVGFEYEQTTWDTALTLRSLFRDKSKLQSETLKLLTENQNSHGDEWIADFVFRYFVNPETTFKSALQFLWIEENDYDYDHSLFIGKKEKVTLELAVSRYFNPYFEAELNLKGFILEAEKNPFHPDGDYDYKGISIGANFTSRF
ncbi:MAG: hypothetical protein JW786_09325 [Desulfobacterales bacterium]|nr:hypothetical protein [Desulfobacterales bacterium]